MNIHIQAIGHHDEKFEEMMSLWQEHIAVNSPPSEEVCEYFKLNDPTKTGFTLCTKMLNACTPIDKPSRNGYEIDLSKLPPGITHIVVYDGH